MTTLKDVNLDFAITVLNNFYNTLVLEREEGGGGEDERRGEFKLT